jgi:hypothetical protein
MQIIHILQIDDNKEHCDRLKTLAWRLGKKQDLDVRVSDFQNLEEGYAELEKEIKYKALILDAQCVINKGENEDLEFLSEALRRLDEINRKTNRIYTPFAINTGFAVFPEVRSQERSIIERNGKVFDKSDEENMLAYLFEEISKSENTKIEKEYADVFEVFEKGYLDSKFRIELLKILKTINDDAKNQENLRAVRVIQDEIYNSLNRKNSGIVPTGSFTNKNKHLSGNTDQNHSPTTTVFQTNTISFLANMIYRISSEFGNHPPRKPTNVTVEYWEMPSKYAVKSLIFALLEQLLWFKSLMK